MAAIKLPNCLTLGENAIKNWKIFKQRWTTYATLTDLATEYDLSKQKALFTHCLDDDALEAYNTFQLEESATMETVLNEFEKFVVGESNVTYERFIFNKRAQEEGESFELYYADLQRLIKSCDYCNECQKSILKDRIVIGIRDANVQKDLLKVRDLTVEKAVDICRASEKATVTTL